MLSASSITSFALTWALLAVRVAVVFGATPVFEQFPVPTFVRAAFVFAFAAALVASLPDGLVMQVPGGATLVVWVVREAIAGGVLAICINIAFAAFSLGARLLDVQIGFGISQVFDPVTRRDIPILTGLFANFAVLAFFATGAYVVMIRAFAYLIVLMPPAADALPRIDVQPLLVGAARLFVAGLALVGPVMLCVLIVEMALVMTARSLPRMNVFAVGLPLKIVTGFVALALWLPHMRDAVTHAFDSGFDLLHEVIR
jgi:flagellar biosynthetic protein FliR